MSEYYKKYRPKTLKGVVGQDGAVASLQRFIDKGTIPHCILLTGPSGCLSADEVIYDPIDHSFKTIEQRWKDGKMFHVFSWNGKGLIPSLAFPPERFTPQEIFEMTDSEGRRCKVTKQHKVMLTSGEYISIHASEQLLQKSSDVRLWSSGEYVPSALLSNEQHWNRAETSIHNIKKMGVDYYYDFHVPVFNNYWMNGCIHHNCGKTTIGRILKTHLNCGNADYMEINSADFKGIDTIREIRRNINLSPISGSCRIWLIDESHQLTKDAQNALLKMLEDTPSHVYFILATTDPQKLIKTIHTRASEVKLQSLDAPALKRVLLRVINKEQLTVGEKAIDEIIDACEGSARKALVILEQVGSLETEELQITGVAATSINKDAAINLARALINPRANWKEVAALLRELKDEPEGIRYLVLGYCRSVLLGGGPLTARAYMIIDIFSRNFYDSKHAGLAAACYEVVQGN